MTRPEQIIVQDGSLSGDNSDSAAIVILVDRVHLNSLAKHSVTGELLRLLAEVLVFLWTVNAIEPDLLPLAVVHGSDRVAIAHADDFALPRPAEGWRDKEEEKRKD